MVMYQLGEIVNKVFDTVYEALRVTLSPEYFTAIDGVITAGNTGYCLPFLIENDQKKTIYVKTTADCTVYIKGGIDDSNMHFLMKDVSNVWSMGVNNDMKCIDIDEHLRYMQIIVDNTDASDSTTKVSISGG